MTGSLITRSTNSRLSIRAKKVSLGVVRPKRIIDLEIREADSEWKPEWENLFSQMTLFGPPQKPLRKIPYSFHYKFECDDSDKPHTAMCEDWELGTLFLNQSARLSQMKPAAESVKKKFFGRDVPVGQRHTILHGDVVPLQHMARAGCVLAPEDSASITIQLTVAQRRSTFSASSGPGCSSTGVAQRREVQSSA